MGGGNRRWAFSEWVYECKANYSSRDGSPVIEIGYVVSERDVLCVQKGWHREQPFAPL